MNGDSMQEVTVEKVTDDDKKEGMNYRVKSMYDLTAKIQELMYEAYCKENSDKIKLLVRKLDQGSPNAQIAVDSLLDH